jgi:hypothetical protein
MSRKLIPILLLPVFITFSCISDKEANKRPQPEKVRIEVNVPPFDADSAFKYVKAQTDLGPRTPGSEAHSECAEYLRRKLSEHADSVIMQDFGARAFDGSVLKGKNIIGIFQPEKRARVMLSAHWDSRPFADHDPDPAKRNEPVMGANDGASGVGVLLEIARIIATDRPSVGIDIVFFDLEDHGPPHDDQSQGETDAWGLGSQYWSRNPHVYNYNPRYMILLDMVGAEGAKFMKEGFSMYYASDKVEKVWGIADDIGYGDWFPDERGGYINDDHYFVNTIANIPAINIIHLDPNSSNGSFFEYWHTVEDTIDKIDPETLQVVGDVVLAVIFRER